MRSLFHLVSLYIFYNHPLPLHFYYYTKHLYIDFLIENNVPEHIAEEAWDII